MFLDEASLLAQLHHPGIAQIYDLGQVGGAYYLAMEYVPGFDLMTISLEHERHGELMLPELCARIVADAADALHYAHDAKGKNGQALSIVHRDVTPHNILLSTQGQVKLIDFGVARASSATHRTQAGFVKGKYPYMSPEQITGQYIDRRVDVYALGLVLYELLTNVRAIAGQTEVEQIDNARSGRIRPIEQLRPNTPVPLRQIVGSCLLVDPDARYHTALALKEDLEKYIEYERHLVGREDLLRLFRVVAADVQQEGPPTTQPVPGPGDDVWLAGRPTELDSVLQASEAEEPQPDLGLAPTSPSMGRIVHPSPVPLALEHVVGEAGPAAAEAPPPTTEGLESLRPSRMPLFAGLAVAAVVALGAMAYVLVGAERSALAEEDAGLPARFVFPPEDAGVVETPGDAGPALAEVEDAGPAFARQVETQAATLAISSVPVAEVFIDRQSWRRTPVTAELMPGPHTVLLVNAKERFKWASSVRLGPGEAKALNVVGRKGTLKIQVTPFAAISLNGEPLGQVSYKEVELYEGSYIVDLELSDSSLPAPRKKRATVTIKGGETTRVDENMLNSH